MTIKRKGEIERAEYEKNKIEEGREEASMAGKNIEDAGSLGSITEMKDYNMLVPSSKIFYSMDLFLRVPQASMKQFRVVLFVEDVGLVWKFEVLLLPELLSRKYLERLSGVELVLGRRRREGSGGGS